jgi:RecJ-like exonuclease
MHGTSARIARSGLCSQEEEAMQGDSTSGGGAVPNGGDGRRNPADQATPGSPQTGMVPCPDCHGSGKQGGGAACPGCGGTGQVVQIVGAA